MFKKFLFSVNLGSGRQFSKIITWHNYYFEKMKENEEMNNN